MRFLSNLKKIRNDARGGLALLVATLFAMAFANSPIANIYFSIGTSTKPSLLFLVNEGLMTLFFLIVGLEIRREIVDGELNSLSKSALPAIAALGGMLIPALIYLFFTSTDKTAWRGFGVPVATDIAFALGALSVFGKRVPTSLRAFLMALAIFDDIGAILLIAIFYSHGVSFIALLLALIACCAMLVLRKLRIERIEVYIFFAAILWALTLLSGIHATISGVVIAFLIPTEVHWLQHRLEPWVTFLILPLFAFLNAGIALGNSGVDDLMMPVSLGIIAGLVVGKPLGVWLFTWICVSLRLAPKPKRANWIQLLGVAFICGIGFTMSLFVGMLAFERAPEVYQIWLRSGVLIGSLASALIGGLILSLSLSRAESIVVKTSE